MQILLDKIRLPANRFKLFWNDTLKVRLVMWATKGQSVSKAEYYYRIALVLPVFLVMILLECFTHGLVIACIIGWLILTIIGWFIA